MASGITWATLLLCECSVADRREQHVMDIATNNRVSVKWSSWVLALSHTAVEYSHGMAWRRPLPWSCCQYVLLFPTSPERISPLKARRGIEVCTDG